MKTTGDKILTGPWTRWGASEGSSSKELDAALLEGAGWI